MNKKPKTIEIGGIIFDTKPKPVKQIEILKRQTRIKTGCPNLTDYKYK